MACKLCFCLELVDDTLRDPQHDNRPQLEADFQVLRRFDAETYGTLCEKHAKPICLIADYKRVKAFLEGSTEGKV